MGAPTFQTKELSQATWPDFEHFFSQGNGWDFCACSFWQVRPPSNLRGRAERGEWNLQAKCDLVARGETHGILMYHDGEPVGWCQYGPATELALGDVGESSSDWRVTCFCTDKRYRGQGVSATALGAALDSIAASGGGSVEGYPVATLDRADPVTAERFEQVREWYRTRNRLIGQGKPQPQWDRHLAVEPSFEVDVRGVGPVTAWHHPDRQLVNGGTVAMFERAGFEAVRTVRSPTRTRTPRPLPTRVVMRTTVQASTKPS